VSYLLDTGVLCEMLRPKPDARVQRWLRSVPEETLHLSVLTVGELRAEIDRARSGTRREKRRAWLEEDLRERFSERLLPITAEVAECWGRLRAEAGGDVPAIEGLQAATAVTHGLRLVTRKRRGLRFPGLEWVNPWEGGG